MEGEQTLLQQFDFNEQLLLQLYGAKPYFWKLQKVAAQYSVEDRSSLSLAIKSYIQHFTQIKSGKDKEIQKLTDQFVGVVKSYFRNLKLDLSQFTSYSIGLHDKFHSQLIDLRRDAATTVLSESKKKFHFTPLLSRFLLKDIVLEEQEGKFITIIIENEQFNQEKLKTLFLNSFQDFITGFSLDKEETILQIISKALKVYLTKENELLDSTVGMLKDCLQEAVNIVKPTRTLLLMMQLPDGPDSINHWELVTENVFDNEEIELKQVISTGETGIFATFSLKQTNALLLVISQNFITNLCETDIPDCDTVFCEGSNQNFIVYFNNTLKKYVIAYEQENRLITRKEHQFNVNGLIMVKSAVLIQKNHAGLINQDGHFLLINLEGKASTVDSSQVCLKVYEKISLSQCGNFIVLASNTETFVFNQKMEMMILDYGMPMFSFMLDASLICIEKQGENNIVIRAVEYPFSYEKSKSKSSYTERISMEYKKTMEFGKNLLTEMLKENKFVGHSKK